MEKINVSYSVFESGAQVEKAEELYIRKPVYADQASANQQAKKWSDSHGMEVDTNAVVICTYVCKNEKGESFTYDEIMQMQIEKVNALFAQAVIAYMGVRDPKPKSSQKKNSGAK